MRKIYLFLFLSFPLFGVAQKHRSKEISEDSIINLWSNSVINIKYNTSLYNNIQIDQILNTEKPKDSIEAKWELERASHQITGTAVLLRDGNKKYLLTAKHMILDTTRTNSYARENKFQETVYNEDIEGISPFKNLLSGKQNFSFPLTLVPDFNVPNRKNTSPVIFYDDADLALISLQIGWANGFLEYCKDNDIRGIDLNQLDTTNNLKVGTNIFIVGFPSLSHQQINSFGSVYDDYSFPIVTFGKIAMWFPEVSFFIGDITLYPGNSGGPVVSNNKLIGIVSAQTGIPLETEIQNDNLKGIFDKSYSRGVLGIFYKANLFNRLINMMQQREESADFKMWNR